uniref:Aminoglycoside phosphotransferase domain-containing protein n=1 Tax=Chromera velia CCMP2878 TaxID=1169474 RepID=A0A0G4G5M0_9ALVE|eukprot:Cvel_20319.t1-p1 / transcript=Cvel_20319.t1 / gene=Cvel_20319 / organism=Chromera_velia_CCMP2878 / gene_product=hypothetical protein / transcript_product=hypothetical protein / location=Cvel_scaffold1814:34528-35232(-) / protein_length=235 / sequence_SO=supercontig / SO=protein_coding / is_pseudo=false
MLPLHLCRVAKPIRLAAWDDGARVLVLEDLRTEFSKSANTRCILRWLAAFHAVFYERADLRKLPVWKQGCYWHLETRPDELAAMDVSDPFFARLKKAAPQLDGILSEGPGLTLLHGDAKHPNFLADPCGAVAAVDFQYCGIGQPMKDVAYLLDDTQEDAKVSELLKEYGEAFYRAREEFGLPQLEESLEAFVERQERMFDVAAADLLRFLAGWGFWGHTERQRRRAEPLLARLLE